MAAVSDRPWICLRLRAVALARRLLEILAREAPPAHSSRRNVSWADWSDSRWAKSSLLATLSQPWRPGVVGVVEDSPSASRNGDGRHANGIQRDSADRPANPNFKFSELVPSPLFGREWRQADLLVAPTGVHESSAPGAPARAAGALAQRIAQGIRARGHGAAASRHRSSPAVTTPRFRSTSKGVLSPRRGFVHIPGDGLRMDKADEYRANAARARSDAEASINPENRKVLLRVAQAWEAMADGKVSIVETELALRRSEQVPQRSQLGTFGCRRRCL
jgi:hypothetical protein